MTEADREKFDGLLRYFETNYGPTPEGRAQLLWDGLADLAWADVKEGGKVHLATSSFWPKLADIRRPAVEFRERRLARERELEERRYREEVIHEGRDRAKLRQWVSPEFLAAHPKHWLHYRRDAGLVAGDIDWSIPVEGCCARATADPPKPVVAAGPKQDESEGGGGDWLSEYQQQEEERRW